mmetsp:Transcript_25549/g.39277  ORF Transcript_25549/g.39277 Transcript_25549/m.39277 type:complete len:104 (+) Transcript_25549:1574-1885(+)
MLLPTGSFVVGISTDDALNDDNGRRCTLFGWAAQVIFSCATDETIEKASDGLVQKYIVNAKACRNLGIAMVMLDLLFELLPWSQLGPRSTEPLECRVNIALFF